MEKWLKLKVDIAVLRLQLVELMKDGFTTIPLEDLLLIIKNTSLIKEKVEEINGDSN